MKKFLSVILSSLLCFSFSLAKDKTIPPPFGKWSEELQLSKEQESKIADLHLKLKKEILPLQSKLVQLRSDLKMEIISDNFSETKVKNMIEEIASIEKDIQLKQILNQRAIRDLLTAEQKKKYDMHILSRPKFGDRERPHWGNRPPRQLPPEPPDKEF